MDPLLDLDGFKARTTMPASEVDALQSSSPGWILTRLKIGTSRIYARLRKRYAVPFASPPPEIVCEWLVAIVTPEAYRKRGWAPSDEQIQQIEQDQETALAELKEAADSETGLFDLPLREDTTTDGIAKAGPTVYAEASPYDWTDAQAEAIRGR